MYTPYLMIGYAATLLLVFAGLQMVRRSAPDLLGIRSLRGFILCGLGGVIFIGLHAWIPAFFGIILPNFLFLTGALLLFRAATEILHIRTRSSTFAAAVCLSSIPFLIWITYFHPWPVWRLILHCLVLAFVFISPAVLYFRHKDAALRQAIRACAWLFSGIVVLNLLWLLFVLVARPDPSPMRPDPVDAGFSYMSLLLGLGTVIALAWLSLSVHRLDLQRIAQTDVLTGLLNRRAFEQILRREMFRAHRSGSVFGVMLIDLDHFKKINDSLGHFAGDEVLRRIGATLQEGIRPSDVLARYGGEEFVVLLRGAGLRESEHVAERVRMAIAELSELPGNLQLTASIGVAVSHSQESPEEILHRADDALYRSKRDGRNLVSVDLPAFETLEARPLQHS